MRGGQRVRGRDMVNSCAGGVLCGYRWATKGRAYASESLTG